MRYLIAKDIWVDVAYDGEDGLYKALTKHYDIVILDIHLPKKDGRELCRELRERGKEVLIMMLTSQWTNEDIVSGLNLWADDYLVKPFEYSELLARMQALYRRNMKNHSNTRIIAGDVEMDMEKHEVKKEGVLISLSKLEYDLLKYLLQNKGKALSRSAIYETVWWEFDTDFMFSKTIDVYIGYLRKKLGKDFIETKKSFGFLIP